MIRHTFRKRRRRKRIPRLLPAEATALGTRGRFNGLGWPYTRSITRRHRREKNFKYEYRYGYKWR